MSKILLAHGGGGREMHELLRELFSIVRKTKVGNEIGLDESDDGASLTINGRIVISTDSYTVSPIFFPGGNIGKLAAAGSINDVAVMGAEPIAALDGLIVEEGLLLSELKEIIKSLVTTFEAENVALIAGDFKVMPRGKIDKIVINTTVIGTVKDYIITDSGAKPGDKVIVSGTIGEHGATILALQMGIDAEKENLKSDCEPITRIMRIAKEITKIHAAKDPTRGGLAMTLNEIAEKSGVRIDVDEEYIPIRENVRALCEMLGVDPLWLACEGRVVLVVSGDVAEDVVDSLRSAGYKDASIIGEVRKGKPYVVLKTLSGGLRLLEKPTGEIVPRIC